MKTLLDLLENSSKRWGERVAVARGRESISYKELEDRARKIGEFLGNRKGEFIGILCDNSPAWCCAFFGVLYSGGTVLSLDPLLREKELSYILKDSECRTVFVDQRLLNFIREKFPQVEAYPLEKMKDITTTSFPMPDISPDDTALLIYTSGTMGTQKGVMLSHRNILSNIQGAFEKLPYRPGTTYFSLLPLSHTFGITVGFLGPLYNGGKVVFTTGFKSYEIMENIRLHRPHVMVVVPLILQLFKNLIEEKIKELPQFMQNFFHLNYKMARKTGWGRVLFRDIHRKFGGRLRYFICGGAPLDSEIEDFFRTIGIPPLSGYGLTEASPVVSVNTLREYKKGSVGKPLSNVEVKIADGEVIVRGPSIMKGYYKNEKATREIIKDGWLHTGDIGEIDQEGFLFLKGRRKNVIVTKGGLKIFPEEIEQILSRSPLIKEVCVVGRPSGNYESPYAVIYPDYSKLKGLSEDEIYQRIVSEIEKLEEGMASYRKISGFEVWKEELPKTTTRKIKRKTVLEMLRGERKQTKAVLDSFAESIREIVCEVGNIKKEEIGPDTNLTNAGIDSLMKVEILCAIEKKMGIFIPEEISYEIETFQDLVKTAEKYRDAPGLAEREILAAGGIDDLLKDNFFLKLTRILFSMFVYNFSRWYLSLKVFNRDKLPREGSFIIASNHTSLLDFPLIYSSLPPRVMRNIAAPAAKDYFFQNPVKAWLVQMAFRAFPLERYGNFFEGLRVCAKVIDSGKPIVLFPEGTRSIKGTLLPFKPGIGMLSFELGVPIIPAYIKGAFEVLPKGEKFPKPHPVKIIFGDPIYPEKYRSLEGKMPKFKIYHTIVEDVRKEIEKLMRMI